MCEMSDMWGGRGVISGVNDIAHERAQITTMNSKLGAMASGLQKLSALYIEKID